MSEDVRWEDARRLEAWAGEVRVNLVRLAALIAFYGHHLVNVYLLADDPELRGAYHTAVTVVVIAWATGALLLHLFLTQRRVPPGLKYAVVLGDALMLTALLALTRDSPCGPLVLLYFLILASAPLRLSLRLVYTATFATMAAYLFLLGHYVYVVVGSEAYYGAGPRIPRTQQVIFLLALGAAGLLAGQAVRQARRLVQGYPVAVADKKED